MASSVERVDGALVHPVCRRERVSGLCDRSRLGGRLTAGVNRDKRVVAVLEVGLLAERELGRDPPARVHVLGDTSGAGGGRGHKSSENSEGREDLHFEEWR